MMKHRGVRADKSTVSRVADLLPGASARPGWPQARGLFRQLVQITDSGTTHIPDTLSGAFADAIEMISAGYTKREAELCEHALAILADVEHEETLDLDLFRKYYEDERFGLLPVSADRRRRPGPFEAITETCRRLRDARFLRDTCRATGTSGLVIGSMNYGRFYNIRGNRHGAAASDLDLIIIINHPSALDKVGAALTALPGVAASELEHFSRRIDVFTDDLDDGRTIFSHKIRLWADGTPDPVLPSGAAPGDYILSLHVVTLPVLDYLLVTSSSQLLKETAGSHRTLRDYRQAPTSRLDDLHDFSGYRHSADLGTEPVTEGFLRSSHVYYINKLDWYFPGFHQTMLFPPAGLLWDDLTIGPSFDQVQDKLRMFHSKIRERISHEATYRTHTMLRPSFAHVRRDAFTPGITRLLDMGY